MSAAVVWCTRGAVAVASMPGFTGVRCPYRLYQDTFSLSHAIVFVAVSIPYRQAKHITQLRWNAIYARILSCFPAVFVWIKANDTCRGFADTFPCEAIKKALQAVALTRPGKCCILFTALGDCHKFSFLLLFFLSFLLS